MEDNEELKSNDTVCPEGVWLPNYALHVGYKRFGDDYNGQGADVLARLAAEAILNAPELRMFEIDIQ